MNDPCSLYADDIAIFLSDLSQLGPVLSHIDWVGGFTGLKLNLEKTIAFDPAAQSKLKVSGIEVRCASVKYLGAYLGLGDITRLNFEAPLCKAKAVLSCWRRRSLTLDARILVLKIFAFSVFVHILNTVHITGQ